MSSVAECERQNCINTRGLTHAHTHTNNFSQTPKWERDGNEFEIRREGARSADSRKHVVRTLTYWLFKRGVIWRQSVNLCAVVRGCIQQDSHSRLRAAIVTRNEVGSSNSNEENDSRYRTFQVDWRRTAGIPTQNFAELSTYVHIRKMLPLLNASLWTCTHDA